MKKSGFKKPFHRYKLKLNFNQTDSMMLRLALSYSAFLFVCLLLCVGLFYSSARNSRDKFWHQNYTILTNSVTIMDGYLNNIDSCCRQLSYDDTFYRLANMASNESPNFYYTALQNKSRISTFLFMPSMVPVDFYYIFLRNSEYVLSTNLFDSGDIFYNGIGLFLPEQYESWQELMLNAPYPGTIRNVSSYSRSSDGSYMYLLDMDEMSYRTIPATACFRLSDKKLAAVFRDLPLDQNGYLMATDETGEVLFCVSGDGAQPLSSSGLAGLSYTDGMSSYSGGTKDMHVSLHTSEVNGWNYYLVQPETLAVSQIRDYAPLFQIVLFLVGLFGLIFIVQLARRTIRPVILLDDQLKRTIIDKESLERELEDQKPIIRNSYVRQLMLGSLANKDEVSYIRDYLGLSDGTLHFNVLYAVVYNNDNSGVRTEEETAQLVTDALTAVFTEELPLYMYTPAERIYALLLCTRQDPDASLLSLQSKVLHLHNELLENHDIWLFAGIGRQTDLLTHIWESFQQAQEAASYSANNYIFLPYEVIQKSSDAYYYPPELSTKLIHFISTGNKPQVLEIFRLIHKENMVERSLPNNLLKFLFSDIRNTLLRVRFTLSDATEEEHQLLVNIDRQFNDHLSFKLCEDIALSLCDIFASSQDEPDLIRTIVTYIREHYQDPSISLNKISDEFHISESYFSHLFKEKCGVNFSVYLEDLRLNEAARQIQETDCTISELYLKVGYNNPASFRRAFKKKFGVLPSAFKNG